MLKAIKRGVMKRYEQMRTQTAVVAAGQNYPEALNAVAERVVKDAELLSVEGEGMPSADACRDAAKLITDLSGAFPYHTIPTLLLSNVRDMYFGYFDLENIVPDNVNRHF